MNDENNETEVEENEMKQPESEVENNEVVDDGTGVVIKNDLKDDCDNEDDDFDDEDEAIGDHPESENLRGPIGDDEVEPIKLSELDLTVQTITLGTDDSPHVSLMKGHVDEKTFVRGFHAEGWNNDGTEYTDEQVEQDAKCEVGELKHTYGAPYSNEENGREGWHLNLDMSDPKAEPITIRNW